MTVTLTLSDDEYIKKILLDWMICKITTVGGLDELLEAGAPSSLLESLRNIPVRQLNQLASMKQLHFTISTDSTVFIQSLGRIDLLKRTRELQEYFVKHGACPAMLAKLFKLSDSNVRSLRALCSSEISVGRRPTISDDEQLQIVDQWNDIVEKESDIREQYYQLHQQLPQYSMHLLWNSINPQRKAIPQKFYAHDEDYGADLD